MLHLPHLPHKDQNKLVLKLDEDDGQDFFEIKNSGSTDENKVEELMNMALAEDSLKIRGGNELA